MEVLSKRNNWAKLLTAKLYHFNRSRKSQVSRHSPGKLRLPVKGPDGCPRDKSISRGLMISTANMAAKTRSSKL
jgi:hypothetical protein